MASSTALMMPVITTGNTDMLPSVTFKPSPLPVSTTRTRHRRARHPFKQGLYDGPDVTTDVFHFLTHHSPPVVVAPRGIKGLGSLLVPNKMAAFAAIHLELRRFPTLPNFLPLEQAWHRIIRPIAPARPSLGARFWAEPPLRCLKGGACGKWAHTLTSSGLSLKTEQKNRSPEAAGFVFDYRSDLVK